MYSGQLFERNFDGDEAVKSLSRLNDYGMKIGEQSNAVTGWNTYERIPAENNNKNIDETTSWAGRKLYDSQYINRADDIIVPIIN